MRSGGAGSARQTAACRRRRLPFPGARQLLDLADDQVLLQAAEPIDEQCPVEMVDLVLKAARQQPVPLDDLLLALAIPSFDDRPGGPRDGSVEARHAQAAFFFELHPVTFDEFGV